MGGQHQEPVEEKLHRQRGMSRPLQPDSSTADSTSMEILSEPSVSYTRQTSEFRFATPYQPNGLIEATPETPTRKTMPVFHNTETE
jgi:hypothetical protein